MIEPLRTDATPAETGTRFGLRALDRDTILREGAQMLLGSLGLAGLLWLIVPVFAQYGFVSVLVHSIAISMTAWGLLGIGGRLGGLYALRPRWLLVTIMMLAGFVAYGLGSLLARVALGIDNDPLLLDDDTSVVMTALVVTGLITVMCTAYFFGRERMAELRAEAAEEAHRAESARLAMLRAQIDPHMLFNTLSALRALIALDPPRAVEMLDHLNDFLRATLDGSRRSMTTLSDEFRLLDHYLELMAVRMGDRLRKSLELPTALRDVRVPALLLQPLVENAIRHGLEPALEGGEVRVTVRRDGDTVLIRVSDTGVGIADLSRAHGGFGLASVRQRLQALHGERATLEILSPDPSTGLGSRITLGLPAASA